MSIIPLGTGDWELPSEDISRVKVRNMYLIENPMSPDEISRVTRPSLQGLRTVGSDPIKALWRQSGAIENRWLIVSGETLYARSTDGTVIEVGSLPGSGYCDIAADKTRALVARDGLAYFTDGVTLEAPVEMPSAGS